MKRIINTYFTILIGAVITLSSFLSCTDLEDIEISYKQDIGITAMHIFDNYEQFTEGDFDMSKDGWKLNLLVLVYDESGHLVEKSEKLCSSLSESLNYAPSLEPGEYTVICIADFRDGLGGNGYKFWNIENESNLQDLSITENSTYFPVVFETLGLDVQKLNVTDKAQAINADIKPVTSLVHVYMSDKDYSGWGIDGYSRFSVLTDGYFIKALKAKNNVRFEGGNPTFNYSEQLSNYNLAISEVLTKWTDKKAPTTYLYRALLPEENKGFSFQIQKRELPQDAYDTFVTFCGEFDTEGTSEILPEISSNKQYVVNMILDAMQLVVMEYPTDYNHERYTEQFVLDYNNRLMEDMVNTKYENILEKDEDYANVFLDMQPYDHSILSSNLYVSHYPRSKANHYEQFVTTAFLKSDYTSCCQVQLLLPTLSDASFDKIKSLLSERFQAEEEGKFGPNNFTYIEPGVSEEDSKYRIALEKRYNEEYDQYTYFLTYNLRSKYYPQEEDLWIDFTSLFGSEKNTIKSALEDYGYSYIFTDETYSANGSDYYYIENNDYTDMVGFVFNTDNQVSQYWIYYKPSKVNDVYNYLSKKYNTAENENTEYVYVFYNDNRNLKVVLDLMNGAVVYTKLDMKQHETPA